MEENNEFVFLDKTTDFTGEIKTSNVILEGKISGTVYAKNAIRLKPGSEMEADVYTENFFAEKASVYDGKLKILKTKQEEKPEAEQGNDHEQNNKTGEKRTGDSSIMKRAAAVLGSLGLL